MRPCPRIAPTLPSIEVEVEAEAATRELGGAAPITGRSFADTRQQRARDGFRQTETDRHVDLRGRREAGDFSGPFSAGFPLPRLLFSLAGYAARRYGALRVPRAPLELELVYGINSQRVREIDRPWSASY